MDQHRTQSTGGGFPVFERPSEAVVFWMLENLCREAGGKCSITFADLARQCSLAQSTVKRVVHHLADRRVIRFWPGCNQYQGSVYEVAGGNHEMLKKKQMLNQVQHDEEGGGVRVKRQDDGAQRDPSASLRSARNDGRGDDGLDDGDSIALNTGLQNDEIRGRAGVRGGGGKVSHQISGRPKIGQPNPSDSDSDSSDSISIGDNDIAGVVHNKHGKSARGLHRADATMEPTEEWNASGRAEGVRQAGIPLEDPSEEDRLAFQVADGLEDVKNLRLYESYCRRYPVEVILTAYVRAREVSPEKIKKSRGALFNFLVQKYGGENKNNSGYSGSAPWSARDGRGRA